MPKSAEFDKAAQSMVAQFPIAKDSSNTADKLCIRRGMTAIPVSAFY